MCVRIMLLLIRSTRTVVIQVMTKKESQRTNNHGLFTLLSKTFKFQQINFNFKEFLWFSVNIYLKKVIKMVSLHSLFLLWFLYFQFHCSVSVPLHLHFNNLHQTLIKSLLGFKTCCSIAERGLVNNIQLRIGLATDYDANPLGKSLIYFCN